MKRSIIVAKKELSPILCNEIIELGKNQLEYHIEVGGHELDKEYTGFSGVSTLVDNWANLTTK